MTSEQRRNYRKLIWCTKLGALPIKPGILHVLATKRCYVKFTQKFDICKAATWNVLRIGRWSLKAPFSLELLFTCLKDFRQILHSTPGVSSLSLVCWDRQQWLSTLDEVSDFRLMWAPRMVKTFNYLRVYTARLTSLQLTQLGNIYRGQLDWIRR